MSSSPGPWWMVLLLFAVPAWAGDVRSPPLDELATGVPVQEDANSWVRVTNGEWLWGEVLSYRNDELVIDSDQFGQMTIGIADIAAIWNPRAFEWARRDGEIYTGPGVVVDGMVRIQDKEQGVVSFPLDELDGFVEGSGRERDRWSFYVRLGFDGRWGNSEQLALSGGVGLKREDARTRFTFDENSSFGTSANEQTVNNHRIVTELDVFLTRWFYLVVPGAEVYFDRFQNLAPRASGHVGVGFRAEPSSNYEIGFTLAAVYQYARYYSVGAGEDPFNQGVGTVVGAYSEWDVTPDIDFDVSWTSTIILNDLGQTSHHGSVTWSQEIIPDFDLDISAIYDRVEKPPAQEDGTLVKSDDFGLVVGVKLNL